MIPRLRKRWLCYPIPLLLLLSLTCLDGLAQDDLILHYTFDVDSATLVADDSGNNRAAKRQGGVWHQGRVGAGALRLDGPADGLSVSDAGLPDGNAARTMALWICMHAVFHGKDSGTRIASYGPDERNKLCNISVDWRVNRSLFSFSQWGGVFQAGTKVVQDQWYHLAYVYDGAGHHDYYVNGQEDAAHNELHGSINTVLSGTFRIGGMGDDYYSPLSATLDDFRVYNRALSANDVRQLFDLGSDKPAIAEVPVNSAGTGSPPVGQHRRLRWNLMDDNSTLRLSDNGVQRVVRLADLFSLSSLVIVGIVAEPEKLWVASNHGLFIYDSPTVVWSRMAINAKHLDVPLNGIQINETRINVVYNVDQVAAFDRHRRRWIVPNVELPVAGPDAVSSPIPRDAGGGGRGIAMLITLFGLGIIAIAVKRRHRGAR